MGKHHYGELIEQAAQKLELILEDDDSPAVRTIREVWEKQLRELESDLTAEKLELLWIDATDRLLYMAPSEHEHWRG